MQDPGRHRPGRRRTTRSHWLAPLFLVATLAAASACGGGGSSASPNVTNGSSSSASVGTTRSTSGASSTTASTPATTTTAPKAEAVVTTAPSSTVADPEHQEIINRYIGFWEARFAANSGTPNPSHPGLADYATGAELTTVIAETQRNLDEGLALQRRPDPKNIRWVRVVSIDGDRAVVQECFVDDGLVVRRDTGEIVDDTIATHSVKGELVRVDGVWRVERAQLLQRWEGVAGCALDR